MNIINSQFKLLLKSLEKKGDPIAKYLLDSDNIFLEGITDIAAGVEGIDKSSYTPEELEILKEHLSFTPKGKETIFSDSGLITKKYRQTKKIGALLREIIEWNSPKINGKKVTIKSKETTQPLSYIYDNNQNFYVKESNHEIVFFIDPEIEHSADYKFQKTKFADSQYEVINNAIKAELNNTFQFEIVKGQDIVKYYNERSYSDKYGKEGGTLWSCMRSSDNERGIKFYAENPNIEMIVMINKDKKIVARSILWTTEIGKLADRIYYATDFLLNIMIQFIEENHFHRKELNDYNSQRRLKLYNYLDKSYQLVEGYLSIKTNASCNSWMPYLDTFDVVSDGYLSNYYRYTETGIYNAKNTSMALSPMSTTPGGVMHYNHNGTHRISESKFIEVGEFKAYASKSAELNECIDFEGKKVLSCFSSNMRDASNNVNKFSQTEVEKFLKLKKK